MEKFFKLSENKTNVRTEVIAGITTFLTMAYIIAVNPSFLSTTGMPIGPLVTATCLAAGVTTIIMGVYGNLPFALASGMGLNAFFAFTVCGVMKISWKVALTAVFVEGIIFIILSLTKIRELVVNAIPDSLKIAVSAGIGLFIAFIGFADAKIIVNDDSTLVKLGALYDPRVLIAITGIVIIGVMMHKKVRGAILWGILICTGIAWGYALIIGPANALKLYGISLPTGFAGVYGIGDIFWKFDFSFTSSLKLFGDFMAIMVTFLFVDFFDTVGTLVGVASKADMFDKDGKVLRANRALLTDAIGTTFGAMVGVSTVTTYVESAAGVVEGGRTGLTSVITGLLFIVAIFFAPVFVAIPSCATAPALVIVGLLMIQNITKINFNDFTEGIPAFITIILMPLTYSIATGLMFGIVSYAVFNVFCGKREKVSNTMLVLAILFILKMIFIK
ncbi:MAG: NCS2 family permease [Bacillota bacterium]|nr:NCS2 family permease [Bacillota bacterium]